MQMSRNRRFHFLEQLEADGVYFSDHAMRERAPQLYHHFIGRYVVDEEAMAFSEVHNIH